MGSRLRECPDKLFEVFAEVAKPDDHEEDPFIINKYPSDYEDEETLKPLPKFAFPCDTERTTVDHFTFVLTDVDSKLKFGYCRHATGAQTCLCIVSCLPWFEVFYNLLNTLAEIQNHIDDVVLTEFLRAAYIIDVPAPGIPVTIVAGQHMMNFTAPDLNKLPSIPSSRNLTEYYNALDTEKMMMIFASMLHERRIVITSKKLSRLTACVHASADLLYPMYWQYLFIPVLPTFLKDYLSAPMPYLIGVHKSILESMKDGEIDDAVIVDVDKNTIETQYDDFEDLPSEIAQYLKRHLKGEKVRLLMQSKGDTIPKEFLLAMVKLIGGYRDALKFQSGELITFCPETFVKTRPESMQPFLEKILHLQIFQQFINGRLDMLNTGVGFSDIFEQLSMSSSDKLNSQSRYKEWVNNMKKQGKKFQRGGKDIWSDFKGKASPAMALAVENMKDKGRKAYSGLKSKLADITRDDDKINRFSPRGLPNRPQTINISQDLKSTRPPRPVGPSSPSSQSLKLGIHNRTSHKPAPLEEKSSIDDSEAGLSYNRVSINLLSDPDIQNALNKSSSTSELPVHENDEVLLVFDSSDETSSGRGSPTSNKLVDIDSGDTGSTSTQDSFGQIPYIDNVDTASISTTSSVGSDVDPSRPVPPPRRNRAARLQTTKDKLIVPKGKPAPIVKDRLISQRPKPKTRRSLSDENDSGIGDISSTPSKKVESSNPLIRLESFEEEFDPFKSPNSSTVGNLDSLQKLGKIPETGQVNIPNSLNRSAAFKKTNVEMPIRHAVKPNYSSESSPERDLGEQKVENVLCDFDPLSTDGTTTNLRQDSTNSDRQRPVSELLQNWELKTLTSTSSDPWNMNTHKPVVQSDSPQSGPFHKPLVRISHQHQGINPYQAPAFPNSPYRPQNVASNIPSNIKENSTEQNRNSGDPFEDMLNLSLTSSSSQPQWEKFE